MVKKMVFLLIGLFLLSLSNLAGAEEPAGEKPLPTELPVVVVKGTDRSYLEVMRARTLSFMPIRGEKTMLRSFFEAAPDKKTHSHFLSFPRLEERAEERVPPLEVFMEERREISPIALLEPRLFRPFVSYTPTEYEYVRTRDRKVSLMSILSVRGEKTLSEPSVQISLSEISYYLPSKEEPSLPYLYISTSLAAYDNFTYDLKYGRKKDKVIHLLSLGRYSAPQWTVYKGGSPLAKDEDWLNTRVVWDFSENKSASFDLYGYQNKIDLPEEKERNKNDVGLSGQLIFRLKEDNLLKILGWVKRAKVDDYDTDYQDINPGAQIELEVPQIPLNVGIKAENSSYANKSQFHLWIKDEAIVFKGAKSLKLGLGAGIKRIEGVTSEILPQLELTYQFNPKLQFRVGAERTFYLPQFADLYLSRDYVEVNKELDDMVKLWNIETQLKYDLPPLADLSLTGFFNTGDDLIWNWDDVNSLIKPEIRHMNSWGGRLDLRLQFGETFEQGLSYTYQKAENLDDPEKVIPHYPQSLADIWLRWRRAGWEIEMGAEFIEEGYYEENTEAKIAGGWKERFKISRAIGKDIEFFIHLIRNDCQLWKDYTPSEQKLFFGLKVKLY